MSIKEELPLLWRVAQRGLALAAVSDRNLMFDMCYTARLAEHKIASMVLVA